MRDLCQLCFYITKIYFRCSICLKLQSNQFSNTVVLLTLSGKFIAINTYGFLIQKSIVQHGPCVTDKFPYLSIL